MAQQDYTSIILLGAGGLALWYAYEQGWFSSLLGTPAVAATATAAPVVTTAAPVVSPAVPVTPVTAPAAPAVQPIPTAPYSSSDQPWALQMAGLASANALDIDQWNYYFNQLANTTWAGTLSPISGAQQNAMLATLTSLGQQESSTMTLPQWYWLVTAGGGGLSGFGDYVGIPVGWIHQGGVG